MKETGRWRRALDLALTVAMLVVCGLLIWRVLRPPKTREAQSGQPAAAIPVGLVSLDGAQLKGNRAAKAALLMFSDFGCPF
jgi:hypothetical protein